MKVVEQKDEWQPSGKLLQEGTNRPVAAVALVPVGDRVGRGERRERREDVRELRSHVFLEPVETTWIETLQVIVEGIDEDRERQIPLELRTRAGQHEQVACIAALSKLGEQPALADPRLAGELESGGPPVVDHVENVVENCAFRATSNEPIGHPGTCLLAPRIEQHRQIEKSGCGSGWYPDVGRPARDEAPLMFQYLLQHRHEAHECAVVFASFRGHDSPLRHQPTLASCRSGGHAIWWRVEAESESKALDQLP